MVALLFAALLTGACQSPKSDVTGATPSAGPTRELDKAIDRLMPPPAIQTEPGFSATILVPPGQLYDPLTMIERNGVVWVTDDGGTGHYGRIWTVDKQGHVAEAIPYQELTPTIGFDFAPPGFGEYGGMIFTLSQRVYGPAGARQPHVIEVHDPDRKLPKKRICELPNAGTVGDEVGGAGLEGRFGPPNSPFANRFFTVLIQNDTIYQTTADGKCGPFKTFDEQVWGLAFTPDGKRMLATLKGGGPIFGGQHDSPEANVGKIVSVNPDGTIDPKPVAMAQRPTDVEVAPANFPKYGGQIFYTDWVTDSSAPPDEPLPSECKLMRIDSDGQAHMVASGFLRPAGITFVDNSIWISNINRDRSDLPDGSIVRIDLK